MTYVPSSQLPTGQKMALLMLRRGELAEAILEHLREMAAPIPEKDDWLALNDQGRILPSRWALTPSGLFCVGDIARDMARAFGIHHIAYGDAQGTRGPFVRCTCGWSTFAARGRETTLDRYAAQHKQQADTGTLPEAFVLPKFAATEVRAS